MASSESKKHIVVIGLTTALFLAEADYHVTVLGAHVPGDSSIDYTSPWAGAHWLPHSTPSTPREQSWDLQTYAHWLSLLERERTLPASAPRSGLALLPAMNFWDHGRPPTDDDLWWAPHVKAFNQMSDAQGFVVEVNGRTPGEESKVAAACEYEAMCVNVSKYLLYLQKRGEDLGVKVLKVKLDGRKGLEAALEAAAGIVAKEGRGRVDCFVNATGLGAKSLCGDEKMFPVRGQTVLVKGEAHRTITRAGVDARTGEKYGAYSIPRPGSGMTILGGTKQPGIWDETPDPKQTERILKQNAWACPELLTGPDGTFEVVSVQCGLRPAREGDARIEKESVGPWKVVHAYGHAGSGYQNSVGCARDVLVLVGESVDGPTMVQAKL